LSIEIIGVYKLQRDSMLSIGKRNNCRTFMVVVAVESKTKEETEVGTDGGEEEGCGKGMASRAVRVESIREENFNVFRALISN
jgi:hypothetical protein